MKLQSNKGALKASDCQSFASPKASTGHQEMSGRIRALVSISGGKLSALRGEGHHCLHFQGLNIFRVGVVQVGVQIQYFNLGRRIFTSAQERRYCGSGC